MLLKGPHPSPGGADTAECALPARLGMREGTRVLADFSPGRALAMMKAQACVDVDDLSVPALLTLQTVEFDQHCTAALPVLPPLLHLGSRRGQLALQRLPLRASFTQQRVQLIVERMTMHRHELFLLGHQGS